MKKVVFFLFVCLFSTNVFSHDSDLGNWLIYFGNKKINQRWDIHHEAQYRNYNAIGDMEQLLLRTGIGYNLSENNNNVLFGYGFIRSQNYIDDTDDKVTIDEHRIFQQFITKQNFGRFYLLHRYRFEQRWIENQDFKLRFRYFIVLNVPINNSKMTDNTFYLSSYNEIFLNNGDNTFDRNRLYGGLGYKLNNFARFELGYMNQYLSNFSRDQVNIITFLNF